MKKSEKIISVVLVLVIGFFAILNYWESVNKESIPLNDLIAGKEFDNIQSEVISKEGPAIEINEKSHDFGIVRYGDISEHTFKVTNMGTEDLEILKISTSCGCTKASVANSDKTISPGESVEMTVTFDPAVHKDDSDLGNLQRIVYVRTNDPANEEVEVEITATVLKAEKFKMIKVTAQRWFFEPDPIEVNVGDYVELKITSTDGVHSFTLPDFDIDQRVEKGEEVTIKFLADKKGTFEFYCAIQCGGGHDSMRGSFVVK